MKKLVITLFILMVLQSRAEGNSLYFIDNLMPSYIAIIPKNGTSLNGIYEFDKIVWNNDIKFIFQDYPNTIVIKGKTNDVNFIIQDIDEKIVCLSTVKPEIKEFNNQYELSFQKTNITCNIIEK